MSWPVHTPDPSNVLPHARVKAILAFHVFLFILAARQCSMPFEERASPFHEVALEKSETKQAGGHPL